jgi:outer membrane protein
VIEAVRGRVGAVYIALLISSLAGPARAQQSAAPTPGATSQETAAAPGPQTPRVLTLEGALDLAESASEQVAIASAGVVRADGTARLVRSERLPQLFGSASYDRTLESEFEGLFELPDDGESGGGDGEDQPDFSELPFGQANVFRAGLTFSQLLFTGGRLRAQVRQADLQLENANLELTATKAQTTLDVATAFYDAALADRLVTIAQETYTQADRALAVTEEQRAAGRVAEFELLRARVARDSIEPTVVRARNAREIAYLRLKQLLELPLSQPLTLVVDLDDAALPVPEQFATRVAEAEADIARPRRVAVTQQANNLRVAEAAVAAARAERWPEVALRSSFGLVAYPSTVPEFDDWRRNWTVGVGLSLPIFTGGRIRANELIARAGVYEAQARERLTAELAALDEESTRQDLQAARVEWEVSGSTIEQAQRAYEIAELRYSEGLSTQLELSDARLQQAESLVTRAEAARNLQVRRIRYALLPWLPLSAAGAPVVQTAQELGNESTVVAVPQAAGAAATGVAGGQ